MSASEPVPVNPLRARLDAGGIGVGILVSMPGVALTQVLVGAGYDWLFIDMEHGPIGIESVHAMVCATAGSRTAPLVRVPWNIPWLAKTVLDTGAMGVIFPMIRNRAEAEAAVAAVRYPPAGERGFGPIYAPYRLGTTMMEHPDAADREVMCVLLIEHRDAVEDIESIVATPGVDACLIAPFDLSLSYGYRDGPGHDEVRDAIARAEAAILASPAHLGGLALDADAANEMIRRGYRMLIGGIDAVLMEGAAREFLGRVERG